MNKKTRILTTLLFAATILLINTQAKSLISITDNFINVTNPNEPSSQISQTASELAINELHIIPDSGRSGYPVKITLTINNTDQFVAFQFDIILPPQLNYVQDSVWLFRKTDHILIANLINQQTLRIVAFSPTNQPFIGIDGEIVKIMFNLVGTAGTYNVGLSNVVISNSIGVNILTGYYSSYIKIISPDISGLTSIEFGETSVLDTISYDYQLSNTGNDTLIVFEFQSPVTYFWNETPLPQNILPGENKIFNLKFHNIFRGQYSSTYTIRSNDPDEDPFYVDVTASTFAPNYMIIQNVEVYTRDTVLLKIDVDNYETFYDFQMDIDFPASISYVTNSAALTNRKQDHIVSSALLTSNKLRIFSFSLNHQSFLGDSGTVATVKFVAGTDTGTFPLHLSEAILFDSLSQNIIRSAFDGEIKIIPRPTYPLSVNIYNGWNMVSIPGLHPLDQNVNTWWEYRDPSASIFKYSGGYLPVTTVTPGMGYWMKHTGARTYNTGDEWPSGGIELFTHYPITGVADWNLFGGYELIVAAANVTTNPPGLRTGQVYKYLNGYQIATTLNPGYGYWIKLTGAGQIIIPETLAKGEEPVEYFPENWGKIILTDATGINYTLYAVKGEVNLDNYELPPAPMAGMFDIRFSSGRIAEDINSSLKTIDMRGVTYPLTVRVEGMDMRLMDETGKTVNVNLKSGEDVVISDATIQKLMVSGELVPVEYALEQNYPNPFNPSTVIEFSLPENVGNVKLSIYNMLGEKVAELVNTALVAGKYSYTWNAQNVATGMYIYELRTDNFVSVKKMLLLK